METPELSEDSHRGDRGWQRGPPRFPAYFPAPFKYSTTPL
jgi:hypothetical protein